MRALYPELHSIIRKLYAGESQKDVKHNDMTNKGIHNSFQCVFFPLQLTDFVILNVRTVLKSLC